MILMLMSREELDEVANALPYSVFCPEDPDSLEFPVYAKLILTEQYNTETQVVDEVILFVTMSQNELAYADERRRARIEKQLTGYKYTESKETDEATSGAVEDQAGIFDELSGDNPVQSA